jgi:crotonobetaine/carnitine-CoA ligase
MLTYPSFAPHFPKSEWVLPRVLEYQARVRGSRPYLQWTDATKALSFDQVNRRVNRIAHGLAALGVKHGDRVVLFMPNSLELVLSWFAIAKLGAAEVPIGIANKGAFLEHPLKISGAAVAIVDTALAGRIAAVEDALPHLQQVVLLPSRENPDTTKPAFGRIKTVPFESIVTSNEENPGIVVSNSDIAAVLFTSGTTGPSKGVLMPHSQFYFFAEEDAQLTRLKDDDIYLISFPLSHGNAQFCAVYPCMIAGARCVLFDKFSASEFVERLHRTGATVTNLLGVTMSFVYKQPASPRDRGHKLRRIYSAPTAHSLVEACKERYGVEDFVEGFGQTEICLPVVTPPDRPCPPGASGVLVDQWYEVRIADPETDEEVPVGEIGELLLRPKQPGIVSAGYLGMPEKTVETWRNLWWHTGDALRRDEEGWYYFVDRVKDALRRRGENISSFEVEAVLMEHPAIAECAVVAVKVEEEAGEDEVKACLVLKSGMRPAFEEMIAFCEGRMPDFAIPRYLELRDELPKTASEKVQKKKLRDEGLTPATWDRYAGGTGSRSTRGGRA